MIFFFYIKTEDGRRNSAAIEWILEDQNSVGSRLLREIEKQKKEMYLTQISMKQTTLLLSLLSAYTTNNQWKVRRDFDTSLYAVIVLSFEEIKKKKKNPWLKHTERQNYVDTSAHWNLTIVGEKKNEK